MNENVFVGQSNLTIRLDTGISMAGATETKILAKRPNGSKKEFTASVDGTFLQYQFGETDIDRAGIWRFQAFAVIGGKKYFGKIVEKVFLNPLS